MKQTETKTITLTIKSDGDPQELSFNVECQFQENDCSYHYYAAHGLNGQIFGVEINLEPLVTRYIRS